MRRSGIAAITAAVALSALGACGDETPVGAPDCEDAVLLVAQSVPRAELVPCWGELPGGWTVNEVHIGNTGTIVELDSDRAGSEAAVFAYQPACDVTRHGRLPSERDDVAVHEAIRALAGGLDADRFFVFEGGCVRATFAFEDFDDISHAESLVASLELVEREALNARLRTLSEDFAIP